MLYPSVAGSLPARAAVDRGLGCRQSDWAGTWFAIHDPGSGRGLVVRREPSTAVAALWVDEDGGSGDTSSGVLLPFPGTGFSGLLVERQVLCFHDATTWTPSTTMPANCAAAWTDLVPAASTRPGTATGTGTFSTATKAVRTGSYVTWRANLGAAAAGAPVEVLLSRRGSEGAWTGFRTLTTRTADATGVVRFSWRQSVPRWVSVRFRAGAVLSSAAQARWR